ncbi:MAG: hypothetical protein K2K54_01495 [Lachnospiraceae bacterium]|nr:hypothetical protein [Lachnospiraceae bacterium]
MKNFMITKNWIMVPQFLYYIFLFGGGLLTLISMGMVVRGILKREKKQYFFFLSMILIVAVLIFVLAITGKIVGHMMVGGESAEEWCIKNELI